MNMKQRWLVVVDYRSSGIRAYPFYNYDSAVKCYENNADPEQRDIVLSASLFDLSKDLNIPDPIKMKVWRD